jgi:hypothetical protein
MKCAKLPNLVSILTLLVFIGFISLKTHSQSSSDNPASDTTRINTKKITEIDSSRLRQLPFRSVKGAALTSPNTYYLKHNRLFVDGLEADGDFVFVDGMQIADGNHFPYRAIAGFELHRFNQPIRYGNVAGSLIELKTLAYNDRFHFDLDGYTTLTGGLQNNAVELNLGGPLRFGKSSGSNKNAPSFFIASNYTFTNNPDPTSVQKYSVTDQTMGFLNENPLRLSGSSSGGTYMNSEFIGQTDVKEIKNYHNLDRRSSNTFLKLEFPFSDQIRLTVGSYARFDKGKQFVFDNVMFNAANNPETYYRNFDNYLNFEHHFKLNDEMKIGYHANLQYSSYYFSRQDARHQDRYFEYGYLGKYTTYKMPSYEKGSIMIDDELYENVWLLNTWDRDTAYTFDARGYNPQLERFTSMIYELFPDKGDINDPTGQLEKLNRPDT